MHSCTVKSIVVFASGNGTNFQAIAEAVLGETEFRIVEGASDNIQLDALLAKLVHVGREIN